jgi:hypothetical protein
MSKDLVTYIHHGEALEPEEAIIAKFNAMWNAAAFIDDKAQEINLEDLKTLRMAKCVKKDNSVVTGITSLKQLGECLVHMGEALITMSDNKRFLCYLTDRGRA